jgi:hypothetical protein
MNDIENITRKTEEEASEDHDEEEVYYEEPDIAAAKGRVATTGGCGEAMVASAAKELASVDRGKENEGGGSTEAGGGRTKISVPPTPRTGWGSGSVCLFDPHKFSSRASGWRRLQKILRVGARWGSVPRRFSPRTRKPAVILRVGRNVVC